MSSPDSKPSKLNSTENLQREFASKSFHSKAKVDMDQATQGDPSLPEGTDETVEMLDHASYLELQKQLEEAEQKASQYWDQLLRVKAETENLHRRVERDIANAHKFALEKFVMELLGIIDNLERAITAHSSEDASQGSLLDGVKLTLTMFTATLEKFGVKQINPENQPFNPEWHQAISMQEKASTKPGIILNVLQKGYLLNDRLIRPALVVVSK